MNHMLYGNDSSIENPEREVEVTVSITMSKTFTISTTNYTSECGVDEDGYYEDVYYENLKSDVENSIVLPHNLHLLVNTAFRKDLDLRNAKMPRFLKEALEDCSHWNVDELEVIKE